MEKKRAWWQSQAIGIIVALVVLIIISAAATAIYFTQQVPSQPIQFPHRTHIALGAPCQYCHTGTSTGPVAGLPTPAKCWGCHQQVAKKSPELDKLAAFVVEGKSIPWVPVAIQPDFVHFNHQPHIAAKVECQTCHGDLTKMTVAEPQTFQNMGWCLDCHKKSAPENFTRLSDCATCHY